MNWGKQLKAWLIGRGLSSTNIGPGEFRRTHRASVEAAQWQRSKLSDDEAIERVAYAYQANVKRHRDERLPDLPEETQNYYRRVAKSMIAAQMGTGWWIEK